MSVGANIKRIMRDKGIAQNELARMASLSSSGISTALSETGNPRIQTLQAIAEALGTSLSEIVSDQDEPGNDYFSEKEKQLVNSYRALSQQGQEYIRQQLEIAKKIYAESAGISQLAAE